MITTITYCAATCNMGDTTAQEADNYRAWAHAELKKRYPEAKVTVLDNPMSCACNSDLFSDDGTEFNGDDEEQDCFIFMHELWDRCPWSGEFFPS